MELYISIEKYIKNETIIFSTIFYTCIAEGVAGTPWYYVNGVDLCQNPSTFIDFNTWTLLIDSLLLSRKHQRPVARGNQQPAPVARGPAPVVVRGNQTPAARGNQRPVARGNNQQSSSTRNNQRQVPGQAPASRGQAPVVARGNPQPVARGNNQRNVRDWHTRLAQSWARAKNTRRGQAATARQN